MDHKIDLQWSVYIESLRSACRRRGVKAELARYMGVTPQRINHWLNEGKTMPGWAVVCTQNYFHVCKNLFDVHR